MANFRKPVVVIFQEGTRTVAPRPSVSSICNVCIIAQLVILKVFCLLACTQIYYTFMGQSHVKLATAGKASAKKAIKKILNLSTLQLLLRLEQMLRSLQCDTKYCNNAKCNG